MTEEDIADKVRRFAGERDSERTETIINTVLALEDLEEISTLTRLV